MICALLFFGGLMFMGAAFVLVVCWQDRVRKADRKTTER